MPWSRHLAAPLLALALVVPAGGTFAQVTSDGWVISDDGLAMATNDRFDTPPGWSSVTPDAFPSSIAGLSGPDRLYRADGTLESGSRVARLHLGDEYTWLGDGQTPLLATAIADGDRAGWGRQQHIISAPAGCFDAMAGPGDCVHPELVMTLVDLAAPATSTAGPAPEFDRFAAGTFATTARIEGDGTLFSLGGDATVATSVKVRDDDTIVVRGTAEIGSGLGGRLRGYDASIVEVRADGSLLVESLGRESLADRARSVRDVGATPNGSNRRVLACPSSRRGYVISQFFANGVGRNVGPAIHLGLEGGVPVLVSEVIPFDCGAPPVESILVTGPDDGPAATLVCSWMRPLHRPFTSQQDGGATTSSSSLRQRYAIVTVGIPSDAEAFLSSRVGGANGGATFSVGLEGVPLASAEGPETVLWLGESQVGIDSYGPKPFRRLDLTAGPMSFDLVDQQRDFLGDAFDVGPNQKPVTNCADFDFTPGDTRDLFSDGFESGDTTAWRSPIVD